MAQASPAVEHQGAPGASAVDASKVLDASSELAFLDELAGVEPGGKDGTSTLPAAPPQHLPRSATLGI